MINRWFAVLRRGLSRTLLADPVAGGMPHVGLMTNLAHLRPVVARHWRKAMLGVLLIVVSTLLSIPQPLITRYLIDEVILGRQLALLAWVLAALIGIALAERLAQLLEQFCLARFEHGVSLEIHRELLHRVLGYPKTFYDSHHTGYVMSRVSSDLQGLRWFFSSTLVYLASSVLRLLFGAAILVYLEWRLAAMVFLLLPGLVLCLRFFSRKLHVLSHRGMEQQARYSSRLQESLSAISIVKAFSSEIRTAGRLVADLKAVFRLSLEHLTVDAAASLAMSATPALARFLVLAAGAYWVIEGQWTLGSLVAFQAYLEYVYGPAQMLATANLEMQNARAALERVSALFDILPEENVGGGKPAEQLSGEIKFQNVWFSYNGREPVLQAVSFCIRPGERVAIVGPSGVGKTTLVSLILRFYRPTAGEILFDRRPASEYEVRSLRRRIGYVPQTILLFSGSILDNLRYGNPDATEEQVVHASRAAGLHEFILNLPQGYATEIGERGVALSEGQKQRVSLARALAKDPDILVLDEPTSAVDIPAEDRILQMLSALPRTKTVIVVAHRLSTIRSADRLLLLDESGHLAAGTHDSLARSSDYYRSLAVSQEASV